MPVLRFSVFIVFAFLVPPSLAEESERSRTGRVNGRDNSYGRDSLV
jgi:hypothetical protein